jgi:predicted AAA+ superfamily ATPase
LSVGGELFGRAFENWVAHEIRSYNEYAGRFEELFYWRLSTGTEVDFVIGRKAQVAIEAKASKRINQDDFKGLREFKVDHPSVKRRVLVSLESKARCTEDDIEILPFDQFCTKLWAGEIF